MDVHVLVPLKALDRAKSRLAEALIPEERADLMRSLLDHVVGEIRDAGVERITVVTAEPLEGYDVWDDCGLAWNDALAAAIEEVVTAPLVGIVSANAVAIRPPGLVRTHFGELGSAAVHAGLGVDHVVLDLPGLAFDVDTPEDLARMQAAAC